MRWRRALLCPALLSAACSGAEAHRPAAGPAPSASSAKVALPYESPARWAVHPSPQSYMTATMRLADGSCLVTEHSGQRWLTWPVRGKSTAAVTDGIEPDDDGEYDQEGSYSESSTNACSGQGRAAVDRAPEPLVGIVRWAASYAFIGESGTIHEARSPLGHFTRRIPPPEPLWRVRGSGRTLLAVTEAGRLLRWDEERGYERVDLGGALAFDVEVSPSGRALVAAAPEAIFTTEDGGRRFTRAAVQSIGVQRVGRARGGPFLVEGVGTALAWDPRQPASFTETSARITNAMMDVEISPGRSASAAFVAQNRAVIDGDRYWEASVGDAGEWTLWKGTLDGRLSAAALSVVEPDTSNVLIAANGSHVALGIVGWSDDATTIHIRTSRDGGATFGGEIPLILSSLAPLGLALSRDGALLVTGACEAPFGGSEELCSGGPLLLPGGAAASVPRAPALYGPGIAPAFSPDGRSAYFLAESEEERELSLFVSHDGGASFEERQLHLEVDGDELTLGVASETAITVSETGRLGMLLDDSGRGRDQVWLTTDADGRGARVADPPIDDAVLGGFGDRILALGRTSSDDDDDGAPVWESLDGGATWHKEAGPILLRGGYRRGGDVACSQAGCLVGEEATRIGWGTDRAGPLPFETAAPASPSRDLRTPIVCEPRPGSIWTHIDHVDGADVLPDEGDAARGRAAWMLATYDPATGAAGVVAAMAPPSGDGDAHITTKQLLAPLAKGARWAFVRRPQIEGEAMARVTLDAAGAAADVRPAWKNRRLKNLEIAWENLEEGTSVHAVLPDAGAVGPNSIRRQTSGDLALILDVLSISPKGIFMRATAQETSTFFVETSGKARSFELPDWPESFSEGAGLDSSDAVNVDGTFVMTTMFDGRLPGSPKTLLLARPPAPGSKPDAPWSPFAATIAPPSAQRRLGTVSWTYDGGHLAVWMLQTVPDAGSAGAWLSRVLPDGTLAPWSQLPTPYDLPRTPRGCSAAEHRDLPRVRARSTIYGHAAFPGTRHPVLIVGEGRPAHEGAPDPGGKGRSAKPSAAAPASIGRVALLSSGVILRGSPASPCVDAFAARGTAGEPVAVIVLGDLRQGWFFRPAATRATPGKKAATGAGDGALTGIDVRPLTCHFEPSAAVPDSVAYENMPQ